MKEFLRKFMKRLRQCFKEIAFFANYGSFNSLPMSEEDIKEFLKIENHEE